MPSKLRQSANKEPVFPFPHKTIHLWKYPPFQASHLIAALDLVYLYSNIPVESSSSLNNKQKSEG